MRLLRRDDAAQYLGVAPLEFEQIKEDIPSVALCGRRLWDVRDLDAFVDELKGAR